MLVHIYEYDYAVNTSFTEWISTVKKLLIDIATYVAICDMARLKGITLKQLTVRLLNVLISALLGANVMMETSLSETIPPKDTGT